MSWFEFCLFLLSCLAVLLQCFTVWLVLNKSPVQMHSYRFFLVAISISDLAFAVVLGFLIQPDLLFPAPAMIVQGLARFFGLYGGVIAFALAVFAGTCQIHFQNWSLLYRWSVVQERYPLLAQSLTSPRMLVFIAIHGQLIGMAIAIGSCSIWEDAKSVPFKLRTMYNISNLPSDAGQVFLLAILTDGVTQMPAVCFVVAVGLLACACVWLYLSVAIIRLFRAHSNVFSRRTYQLHMQLNVLLILQLVCPILLIILPVALGILGLIARLEYGKSAGQLGVLLFSVYALNSPLMTILFVSPYRRFAFRVMRLEKLFLLQKGNSTAVASVNSRPSVVVAAAAAAAGPAGSRSARDSGQIDVGG